MHIQVLIVQAGSRIRRRRSGALPVQGCLYGWVGDVIQHGHRVQQLVLLHICLAQRHVQLRAAAVGNRVGQGILSLGIVADCLKPLGKLNGHILIVSGLLVSKIVEPCGRSVLSVLLPVACLAEQKLQSRPPVIGK